MAKWSTQAWSMVMSDGRMHEFYTTVGAPIKRMCDGHVAVPAWLDRMHDMVYYASSDMDTLDSINDEWAPFFKAVCVLLQRGQPIEAVYSLGGVSAVRQYVQERL